ncbi:MAG: DUF6089 family protein [Bacteroidota bacterium]
MYKKLLFVLMFVALVSSVHAQRGWEAGPWLGTAFYFGDLNTNYSLARPNVAGGLIARFNFNNRVGIKFGANYGQIEAYDSDSDNAFERSRNLSFRSNVFDVTTSFEFNFLPYNHGSKFEFYTPYIFGGLSVFSFNPEAEINGEWVELRPLGTEGQFKGEEYYTIQLGLEYGVGFKLDLSYEWSLNFELSARHLYTDYLDDVSTVYADPNQIRSLRGDLGVELADRSIMIDGITENQLGTPGTQRGNSKNNDSYVFLKVGIVRYFGDLRCPTPGKN